MPLREFLASCRDEWQQLARERDAPPDLMPGWFEGLCSTRALHPASIWVAWARCDGALSMVWPYQQRRLTRFAVGMRAIESLQNLDCLHAGVLSSLSEPETAEAILGALCDHRGTWAMIEFTRVVGDSTLARAFTSAAASLNLATQTTVARGSPYLTLSASWQDYLASRSANFRQNVKRRERRAASAGEFVITRYTTPEEVDRFFAYVAEIEVHTWKHPLGTSMVAQPWELEFLHLQARTFAPRGQWTGHVAFLDGAPIAHYCCLQHQGIVYGVKHSFDQRHERLSAGSILSATLLEHAHRDHQTEVDFLGSDEAHKMIWTDAVRPHVRLRIYGRGMSARLLAFADRLRPVLGAHRRRLKKLAASSRARLQPSPANPSSDEGHSAL